MNFLFWLLFLVDVCLILLTLWGSSFRSGFGASTSFNTMMLIGYVLVVVGALLSRYLVKPKWISLLIIGLPVIILFIMYLLDRKSGPAI